MTLDETIELLEAAGHPRTQPLGPGILFPVYSEGFLARPCLSGPVVEILAIGNERDAPAHEAALTSYADAFRKIGIEPGRRRLGAGRECLLVPLSNSGPRLD